MADGSRMRKLLRLGLVVLAFVVAHGVATFVAFPIGGGEFHAMFAYTAEGRLGVAVRVYGQLLVVLAAVAALLVARGAPLPWWAVAAVGSALGLRYWWAVCAWQPQSAPFHETALAPLPGIPVATFAAAALAARWRTRRVADRTAGRAAPPPRPVG